MEKIIPHLWYDKEAKEAAEFYASIFPDSRVKNSVTLPDTPSGSAEILTMEIMGQEFMLISAGPYFKFTPAISFFVHCHTKKEVDVLWEKLSAGGKPLMELDKYPFSERYGWTQDKYGLSWQIIYSKARKDRQRIVPMLMFTEKVNGRAEEAVKFYATTFRNAKVGDILRYGPGEEPDKEGTVKQASVALEGYDFAVMDSAWPHGFTFNEAVSFIVRCKDQAEIDYYWDKLSAVPEAEQCGWLKDKFGVSWQIVPAAMDEMMNSGDKEKIARVTEAFLKMKKFDVAELERVMEGK